MTTTEFIKTAKGDRAVHVEECFIDKRNDYWHDVHYYYEGDRIHLVRVIGGTEDGGECEYPHLLTDEDFYYAFCDYMGDGDSDGYYDGDYVHPVVWATLP